MEKQGPFNTHQIKIVNQAVALAEEVVSNFYKMSASQWLNRKYDVKTLTDLSPEEIVDGPFAQIIRYEGRPMDSSLGSSNYDFYKICIQDHSILTTVEKTAELHLFPFLIYIIAHELIHIVRFSKFIQRFDASYDEKQIEERCVHKITHEIILPIQVEGIDDVIHFYHQWLLPHKGIS
ncbi:hypothetical protein QUF90_17175 [Desulfococcaceae bacterium HSG9]|nr:hypothetical protein [Desulfococcaceae bacterium HSG9]